MLMMTCALPSAAVAWCPGSVQATGAAAAQRAAGQGSRGTRRGLRVGSLGRTHQRSDRQGQREPRPECEVDKGLLWSSGAELVVATEQRSSLPYLESNLSLNRRVHGGRVRARELWWGDDAQVDVLLREEACGQGVGLVIGCEITYDRAAYGPLVHTLRRLLLSRPAADVLPARALLVHNHESTPSAARSLASFLALARQQGLGVAVSQASAWGLEPAFCDGSIVVIELRIAEDRGEEEGRAGGSERGEMLTS